MTLQSVNPATGETVESWPSMSDAEIHTVIDSVDLAYRGWRRTDFDARAAVVRRVAGLLRRDAEAHARRMTIEMGKPIAQSRAEVEKCAWACEHYADHGAAFLAPDRVDTDGAKSYVAFRPLGVVLAVMPWNFPYWQVLRFAAPAIMAGNGVVLKHAPNVTGCALAIEALWREAGLPEQLFRAILVDAADVDRAVGAAIDHAAVQAVTLTGSTRAGRAVAAKAGAAVKKTVLELGGSDAYVILVDADLDLAARACAASRLINSGQSCIAAKRFVVADAVREAFTERLLTALSVARVGDPLREDVDVGPLARSDLRENLHRQVAESVAMGARVLTGGDVPGGPGVFYPVTVLADVGPDMPAFVEETFGPVAAIVWARDDEEALIVANQSAYGLGAAVFTADAARGERLAREVLEAGSCFVNAFVKSDPRLPFGGIKQSGYGRELGLFGIREFVNVKTVYVG